MLNIEALSCDVVAGDLAQCIGYLKKGGPVPPACCKGVAALKNAAKTTQDRRDACNCLKKTAAQVGGVNPGFAASLPGICKVNIPYKISTSTNCARGLHENNEMGASSLLMGSLHLISESPVPVIYVVEFLFDF
ncbi:unnamed protein product [Dovyalis caffra]|uniref:Non-specific lipid-transfer protein n=1 Tax=Dovyalis caffra TaxID=77055 RepID=A0AAV1S2B9_9ROSI|nr:unnamed protein product [Dovyalis caffra]